MSRSTGSHGRFLGSLLLASSAAVVLLLGTAPSLTAVGSPPVHAGATPSGSLNSTGICPYQYYSSNSGESYTQVTTSGTLSGFTPGTTYYVYDDTTSTNGETGAAVTANASGQLVFSGQNLGLPGTWQSSAYYLYWSVGLDSQHPTITTDLQWDISTDPNDTFWPPDDLVYAAPTTITANPACNPWNAPGGTLLEDDFWGMFNGSLSFEMSQTVNDDYCVSQGTRVLWCTRTSGTTVNPVIVMQRDGNLVVYNNSKALWETRTNGNPGAHLVLQRDCNLVIYSAAGKALWQSGSYLDC